MDDFTPKERAVNFSKLEKDRFQSLIEKYKEILFCKKTDNVSNIKKNKTWNTIHAEFNSAGDLPRSLRQLKAKFDNMKRNTRKSASQEKQAIIKTEGGPPSPSVEQDTKWFRRMMSVDRLPSGVDGDIVEIQIQPSVSIVNDSQEVINLNKRIKIDNDPTEEYEEKINILNDTKLPASILRTPVSKPLRIRKTSQNGLKIAQQLKCDFFKKAREQEDAIFQLKVKHMEEKRKEEKELHELQKKKLLLEISLLENKL